MFEPAIITGQTRLVNMLVKKTFKNKNSLLQTHFTFSTLVA